MSTINPRSRDAKSSWKIYIPSAIALLLMFFLPKASRPGQRLDPLSDVLLFDKLAAPSIASAPDLESQIREWEALDTELSALGSHLGRDPYSNADSRRKISLARSLLHRFFDFTARAYLDEPRTLALVENRLALNFPQTLPEALRNEIGGIAAASFGLMLKKWEKTVDIDLLPGLIFIKFYVLHESMVREYGLPEEARGVALPCRYIAIALRFDSQGQIVREELENTIFHELIHTFCYMALGFSGIANLPTWFHEGIALELSGQTRLLHITQDAAGIHIMTITSTEEYGEYQKNFRYLKEKYGNAVLFSMIRDSLIKKEIAYESLKTLSAQAKVWFKDKARFEWVAIIVVAILLLVLNLAVKQKRFRLSCVLILSSLFIGSFSPYFRHSKGKYWFGFFMGLLLLYSSSRHLAAIRQSAAFWRRSEKQEHSQEFAQAIASVRAWQETVKSNAMLRFLLRRRAQVAARRLGFLEKKLFGQWMTSAEEYEESLDFEKALGCYERLGEVLKHPSDEKTIVQARIERTRLLLQMRKWMPRDGSGGPSGSGGSDAIN